MKPSPAPYRFAHPVLRPAAGIVAAAVALAVAGLVFGRAADERAAAIAVVLAAPGVPVAAAGRAPDAPLPTRSEPPPAAHRVALATTR